jgi:hypothetical protein
MFWMRLSTIWLANVFVPVSSGLEADPEITFFGFGTDPEITFFGLVGDCDPDFLGRPFGFGLLGFRTLETFKQSSRRLPPSSV